MLTILLLILAIVLLLAFICIVRTLAIKPTPAKTASVAFEDSPRAESYGKALAKLVQCETISSRYDSDRSKFYTFHDKLEELFPNIHASCEKHNFNGSLLFKWQGKGESAPIMLMSHQDVVEAGGVWEHGSFSGDIDEKGRVWGRGTVDTKASLFCLLTAVEELLADGYIPACDVYFGGSCTEEWSGEGAPAMARYLKDNGVHLALLLDEGGMIIEEPIGGVKGTYGMVGVVEKGYGDVKFIARGNGGHASAPKKDTPLVRLGKFMVDVEKNYPFRSELTPTVREMFRRLTPNMNFGLRLIMANLWLFEGILVKLLPSISSAAGAMIRTTLAFTTAKGSDGLNVLPQEAYVTGNMRFIHHQANAESLEIISKLAKKYDIETEVIYQDDPCPIVAYDSDAFRLIEEAAAVIYPNIGICPYTMTGGTDAKYYSEVCDNCIRFAPLYIDPQQYESIHGLNENIYQGTLPMGVDFYKYIIRKS